MSCQKSDTHPVDSCDGDVPAVVVAALMYGATGVLHNGGLDYCMDFEMWCKKIEVEAA